MGMGAAIIVGANVIAKRTSTEDLSSRPRARPFPDGTPPGHPQQPGRAFQTLLREPHAILSSLYPITPGPIAHLDPGAGFKPLPLPRAHRQTPPGKPGEITRRLTAGQRRTAPLNTALHHPLVALQPNPSHPEVCKIHLGQIPILHRVTLVGKTPGQSQILWGRRVPANSNSHRGRTPGSIPGSNEQESHGRPELHLSQGCHGARGSPRRPLRPAEKETGQQPRSSPGKRAGWITQPAPAAGRRTP